MPASIWLRLSDEQEGPLGELIERLAKAHGTMAFQPHLTVCSPQSEAFWDAAGEYVRHSTALPLRVGKKRISYSTTTPMMAIVMYVEDTPGLRFAPTCGGLPAPSSPRRRTSVSSTGWTKPVGSRAGRQTRAR